MGSSSVLLGLFIGTMLAFGFMLVTDEYAPPGDVRAGWVLIGVALGFLVVLVGFIVWANWWPIRRRR